MFFIFLQEKNMYFENIYYKIVVGYYANYKLKILTKNTLKRMISFLLKINVNRFSSDSIIC